MVRQRDANQEARLSAPIKDCDVGAWRHLGGYRIPIAASIAIPQKQTEVSSKIDREKIIACAQRPNRADNLNLIECFRGRLQEKQQGYTTVQDLGRMSKQIADIASKIFPAKQDKKRKVSESNSAHHWRYKHAEAMDAGQAHLDEGRDESHDAALASVGRVRTPIQGTQTALSASQKDAKSNTCKIR